MVVESNRGALRKSQLLDGSLSTWLSGEATGLFSRAMTVTSFCTTGCSSGVVDHDQCCDKGVGRICTVVDPLEYLVL